MKREIKNDGVYVEVDASEILDNLEALKEAKIVVITSARIELAGEDKANFLSRFSTWHDSMTQTQGYSAPEMTNRQRSDIVIRALVTKAV